MKKVIIGEKVYKNGAEAALAYGINVQTLYQRLKRGWTEEDFERGYRKHVNNWKRYLKAAYDIETDEVSEEKRRLSKTIKTIVELDDEDLAIAKKDLIERKIKGN